MGWECTICIRFSKIFSRRPLPLPLLREDKKLPSLALYDPLQLRWKFSHVYRRSELWRKITYFLGKNQHKRGKKLAQNAPFASIFHKFSQGVPPNPHLQEGIFLSCTPSPPPPLRRFAPIWLRPRQCLFLLCPGLNGPQGASSNRDCPSVCLSVSPSRLQTKCNIYLYNVK